MDQTLRILTTMLRILTAIVAVLTVLTIISCSRTTKPAMDEGDEESGTQHRSLVRKRGCSVAASNILILKERAVCLNTGSKEGQSHVLKLYAP